MDQAGQRKAVSELKAKKHLPALRWVFWFGKKGNRRELRCNSPTRKYHYSPRTACHSCFDEPGEGGEPQPPVVVSLTDSALQESSVPQESSISWNSMEGPPKSSSPSSSKKRRERILDATRDCHVDTDLGLNEPKRGKVMKKLIKPKETNQKAYQANARMTRSTKRVRPRGLSGSSNSNPRTILSWLIDNYVVTPRTKVHYRGVKGAEGTITREGIRCNGCCRVFTIIGFELHAGASTQKPSAHIVLKDGRSLLDCQIQMLGDHKIRRTKRKRKSGFQSDWPEGENESICSACQLGGELFPCNGCPASFHKSCLCLEAVPAGDWFCPSCCCRICSGSTSRETNFLTCDQCQRKYHVGCQKNRDLVRMERHYRKRHQLCSTECEEVFLGLHTLLGRPIPMDASGLTWKLLRSMEPDDMEKFAENQCKLHVALDLMHECFEPVKDHNTGRELVEDMIFSRGSEVKGLDFGGFHVVILERKDELISVATVRVYREVAEIPLLATRVRYQRRGMGRILMNELEKQLSEIGVERVILPAAPSVLNTWINSFGFSTMTDTERSNFLGYNLVVFQDTILCQKQLMKKTL